MVAFPIALTTYHLIFSTIATRILASQTDLLKGLKYIEISKETYFKAILPIGALFSCSLVFSNYAYLHLSVSFIQMIKAVTPVAVLLISWIMKTANPNMKVFVNVMMIVTGVILACYGEIEFVWIGFLFQVLGVTFEATRLVMVQLLLKDYKMDPLVALYYFAPVCACFNSVAFLLIEAKSITFTHLVNVGVVHFVLNALCAFGLNVAVVFLVRETDSDWKDFVSSFDLVGCIERYLAHCYFNLDVVKSNHFLSNFRIWHRFNWIGDIQN